MLHTGYFFYDNFSLLWEFFIRLMLATILGGMIGYEREFRSKEAGLRTHILVALGAALVMMVSQYGFFSVVSTYIQVDPSRIAAQVVSGIGFIGAGVIFKEQGSIKGLSTAAGLWGVAAIGLAVGAGLYTLAITATIIILIVFELLKRISKKFYVRQIDLQIGSKNGEYLEFRRKLEAKRNIVIAYKVSTAEDAEKALSDNIVTMKIKLKSEDSLSFLLNEIDSSENLSLKYFEVL
ncbi:MAG: MgtC/SapB family protein [Sarcina sp.]